MLITENKPGGETLGVGGNDDHSDDEQFIDHIAGHIVPLRFTVNTMKHNKRPFKERKRSPH